MLLYLEIMILLNFQMQLHQEDQNIYLTLIDAIKKGYKSYLIIFSSNSKYGIF